MEQPTSPHSTANITPWRLLLTTTNTPAYNCKELIASVKRSIVQAPGQKTGATTFNIMTLSIMTFSIKINKMLSSAYCHSIQIVVMLRVADKLYMLSVVMLNVFYAECHLC